MGGTEEFAPGPVPGGVTPVKVTLQPGEYVFTAEQIRALAQPPEAPPKD